MPLPGFTEQEEKRCRQLGLQLFRAYMTWLVGFAPAGAAGRVAMEELGDFWVVQAKAILDYMRKAEEDRSRARFGGAAPPEGETVQ